MIGQSTPTKPQEHQINTHENKNKYTPPQQPNSCIVSVMVIVKKDNGNKVCQHMQLCIWHHHMFLMSSIITELDSVFNVSKKS